MPAIPVQDMISNILTIVDDENQNTHSNADLVRFINSAVGFYDAFLGEFAETMLMQYRDVTHDGSELQAIMPYLPRIVSVERTSLDPREETIPLPRGFKDRFPYISQSSGTGQGFYYVQNNQLAVVPQQATGTDRVWVILRSPELHYGTCQTSSTTTSFVFASTPTAGNIHLVNDAYNQIPFMLTVSREVGVISDYTGSTKTGTTQFTLENNPAAGIAYSILPVLDPEYHWLYIWQAIIMGRMRTQENTVDPVSERQRLESMLMQRIRKVSKQRNKYFTRHGF